MSTFSICRIRRGAAVFVCVAALSAVATAQGGWRGPQLSEEERDKVYSLQAQGVAQELGLDEETAKGLAEAYKASREKQGAAARAMMEEGERGPGMFQKYRELNDKEREAFAAALPASLSAEQKEKALASLGTYSRQWDRLVHVLAGMNLEGEKQDKALALVAAHSAESDAAMTKAMESGDWQSIREDAAARKEKLDAALAEVLSEEQLATWKEETAFRGGRGGGRGDGPRGGGDASGGGAETSRGEN
jgi:hypothetical protein